MWSRLAWNSQYKPNGLNFTETHLFLHLLDVEFTLCHSPPTQQVVVVVVVKVSSGDKTQVPMLTRQALDQFNLLSSLHVLS